MLMFTKFQNLKNSFTHCCFTAPVNKMYYRTIVVASYIKDKIFRINIYKAIFKFQKAPYTLFSAW